MTNLLEEEVGCLLGDEPVHLLGRLVDEALQDLLHSLPAPQQVVLHVEVVVSQLELGLKGGGGGGHHGDEPLDHGVAKPGHVFYVVFATSPYGMSFWLKVKILFKHH